MEVDIPQNTLINGESYTIEITAYDKFDVPSEASDRIHFRTFTQPVFNFSNLTNYQIIGASSYVLNINYSQTEGELLNEYQINLYDLGHKLIATSGSLYPSGGFEYRLKSLLDNNAYYINMVGTTINGMQISSDEIFFSVEYVRPSLYARIFLENIGLQASIKIQSNIILIDGKANHEPVVYVDGEKIDLTEDGKSIIFDAGFNIEDDFIAVINCQDVTMNKDFFEISNQDGNNKVSIQKNYGYFYGDDENVKEYFTLTAITGFLSYRITSELFDPISPEDELSIVIKRIGSCYDISVEKKVI